MDNIVITDTMRNKAYSTFRMNHALSNCYYSIALEIYDQIHGNNNTEEFPAPFSWDMPKEIMEEAEQIAKILWKEYVKTL